MKKTFLLFIIVFFAVALSGCSLSTKKIENQPTPTETKQPTITKEILVHNPHLHTINFLFYPTNFQDGARWENEIIEASFNRAFDVINVSCKDNKKVNCARIDKTILPEEDYYPQQMSENWCQLHLESSNNPQNENDVYQIKCE